MKITYIIEHLGTPEVDRPPFGKRDKVKKRFTNLEELVEYAKENIPYDEGFSITKEILQFVALDKEELSYLKRALCS